MASSKKIGFFWGEDKITVIEFDKNVPIQIVSSPIGAKTNVPSPFSSNLTEEIQITAVLQKLLQDNHISGGSFYVSLPAKDIILRSFIIPFVKPELIHDAIKFEAKKYMPFDIQDLTYVFHTVLFADGQGKRLQVIFFAVRKEVLTRYERIFKQVNAQVSYCEPYMVSLTKALLFRKEIKPVDHLAFLILDKKLGRICFIDQGIPQFIREFPVSASSEEEEGKDPSEVLNSKIANEVGNSFDFYGRQFSGERIEQMLVSSDFVQKNLLNTLETEIKVKIRKFSSAINIGVRPAGNDMDAIYALGACVPPPMESLSGFNFLEDKKIKPMFQGSLMEIFYSLREVLYVLLICLALLAGVYFYFQMQMKVTQQQFDQLSAKQGAFTGQSIDSITSETQAKTDKLHDYKEIRTRSDMTLIILTLASHLPEGALLNDLSISYVQGGTGSNVTIDMKGDVFKDDPDEQIAVVNKVYSDLKQDKELSKYVTSVNLGPLNREEFKGRQVTGFNIHCS